MNHFLRTLVITSLISFLLGSATVTIAAITDTNRARIILDLLKDGTVANETPYGSVDLASAPISQKYADAFWSVYDGQNTFTPGTPVTSPTNAQKATFFLRCIGIHCKNVLKAFRVPPVGQAAATTETTTVDAEALSDLGQ